MKLQVYMITEDDHTYEAHAHNEAFFSDQVQSGLTWEEMETVWRELFYDRHGAFPRYRYASEDFGETIWVHRLGGLLIEDKSNDTIHFVQIWAGHFLVADLIAKHISENWNGRLVIPEWETDAHKAWLVDPDEDDDLWLEYGIPQIIMSARGVTFLNRTLHAPTSREAA